MITWIKRKYYENKVKLTFYKFIATLLNDNKEILSLLDNLYTALKDVPIEELKDAFIEKVVEIVHSQNE